MNTVLPWFNDTWRRLMSQAESDRLPHGLLFSGAEHAGKTTLALDFATYLLCQGENAPCGTCHQCQLVKAGTHPDLLVVGLEDSRQIRVEQIRDMIDWATQTAQQGGRKVCLVDPADAMNLQASNALLKLLEEPPADTEIFLVSSQSARLLPTIRSRCQVVQCVQPGRQDALSWVESNSKTDLPADLLLEIAGGVPLRTLLIDDEYLALRAEIATHIGPIMEGVASPLQLAAKLSKSDPMVTLEVLYRLIADSIALSSSGETQLQNRDLAEVISSIDAQISLKGRFKLLDRVTEARRGLQGTSNPNAQMLLEWVLMAAA